MLLWSWYFSDQAGIFAPEEQPSTSANGLLLEIKHAESTAEVQQNFESNEKVCLNQPHSSKEILSSSKPISDAKCVKKMKRFKCSKCAESFARLVDLNAHIKNIHKEEPQKSQCAFCDKKFITTWNRKRHEITHHGQTK